MLVSAGLESKSSAEIADAYEAAFHADEAAVNILPAHVFPRATDHIPEMLELAERLVDLGHAYASPAGNVYSPSRPSPGTVDCPATRWTIFEPVIAGWWKSTSAIQPTSPSGSRRCRPLPEMAQPALG